MKLAPGFITIMRPCKSKGSSLYRSTGREKGFTLVEIMVALTILSFMMVSLFTSINSNINTKETVLKEDREFLQIYTAFNRFQQDFSQIYSPLYYSSLKLKGNDEENRREDNEPPKNSFKPRKWFPKTTVKGHPIPLIETSEKGSIKFFTGAHRRKLEDEKQSRYIWVQYSLQSVEDKANDTTITAWVRETITENIYDEDLDFNQSKTHILLKGVKSLKFEYWNNNKRDWAESLKELGPVEQGAPLGIKVIMEWKGTDGTERTIVRIFRPLFPFFDVIKDEKAKKAKPKPNGGNDNE
jgi:prepilin-type N-terminal cleavage/methylation domain-containing protein